MAIKLACKRANLPGTTDEAGQQACWDADKTCVYTAKITYTEPNCRATDAQICEAANSGNKKGISARCGGNAH